MSHIDTIYQILEDEIRGDIQSALQKMHPEYSMTWMYKRKDGILFPKIESVDLRKMMEEVYVIKDRSYKIKNILADNKVVMAELIETYTLNGTTYRTPMVIVWEFEDGKIRRGRHYCDPQLSYENLTEEQVKKIYE